MDREFQNIFLYGTGEGHNYTPTSRGGGHSNYPMRESRLVHANSIKKQFDDAYREAQNSKQEDVSIDKKREGVYLQIKGKEGYELITKSLEDTRQGVRLLNVQDTEKNVTVATVFIPNKKYDFFLEKIKKYAESDKGTDVVGTIENIQAAFVEALWVGDKTMIPKEDAVWVEVWLRFEKKEDTEKIKAEFRALCSKLNILVKQESICFQERLVLGIYANYDDLLSLVTYSSRIAEFRKMFPAVTYYMQLSAKEKRDNVQELKERIDTNNMTNTSVCLLDTGVNNLHPLLECVIEEKDRHTVTEFRGLDDKNGHGSNMAGIAAYFTLTDKLETIESVKLHHYLESVKMFDLASDNPAELYGALTAEAVGIVEVESPDTNRVICMAITAPSDKQLDGRPSSWSGEIDDILFDEGMVDGSNRIMFISAGNTNLFEIRETGDFEAAVLNHSVENPGQAWNAITVGAFTLLDELLDPAMEKYEPIVEAGDISPFTSSSLFWEHKKWPVKPEILLEGGNVAYSEDEDFYTEADELSLLTTGNSYQGRTPFDIIQMTSSATAQASWIAAEIWANIPDLRAETVRALLIHSAEWTPQMRKRFLKNRNPNKGDYRRLLRVCGYGVPDLYRALRSASNSVNMIIEDQLQPFVKKNGSIASNEMHIHTLPWPTQLLKDCGETIVKVKITLSYYIQPGPGEIGWKDKYRYPSCQLRFDMNNSLEDKEHFLQRISSSMRDEDFDKKGLIIDSGKWTLGTNNRDVGSIHSDFWVCTASELADCNMIVVYPVTGWWKTRGYLEKYNSKIRYSLIVSIETPEAEIDLYSAIQVEIKNMSLAKLETKTIESEFNAFEDSLYDAGK